MSIDEAMDFLCARVPSSNGVLECYSLIATDSYVLKSETDVVGAATIHLLHEINAVLNDGLQNGSIKMEHERSKGHKSRTDIRWTFHHSQGEPQVFAVLELKTPNLLAWDDFVGAVARCEEDARARVRII